MAPRFSSSHYSTERRPLADCNRDILSAIPEISKPSSKGPEKNNVSRAVFVKDGMGHDVDEILDLDGDGTFSEAAKNCTILCDLQYIVGK